MLQNRPIALTLIAAALIFQGIEAIIGMIGAFSAGNVNINLMFILLFAGIGLLRLSDGWRKFTVVCLWLGGLAVVAMVVFEVFRPGRIPVTWFGEITTGTFRYILFAALLGLAGMLVWWALRTLTRPEITLLFKGEPNQISEPTAASGRGSP